MTSLFSFTLSSLLTLPLGMCSSVPVGLQIKFSPFPCPVLGHRKADLTRLFFRLLCLLESGWILPEQDTRRRELGGRVFLSSWAVFWIGLLTPLKVLATAQFPLAPGYSNNTAFFCSSIMASWCCSSWDCLFQVPCWLYNQLPASFHFKHSNSLVFLFGLRVIK